MREQTKMARPLSGDGPFSIAHAVAYLVGSDSNVSAHCCEQK